MPGLTPHLAILASAGSGKTYRLVGRLIALLAAGAPPERLLALTFTRAAAGEIFDELVQRLAAAAGDDARAAQESQTLRDLGAPRSLDRTQFAALLRSLLERQHRAAVGTLDSFFAGIVQSFPLELGIAPDFSLMEEHAQTEARQRILRRLLAHGRDGADDGAARRAFLEAFKRATFGREGKKCQELLDGVIGDFHGAYLQAPAAEVWGDPARIWPGGAPPWRLETAAALRTAAAEFRAGVDKVKFRSGAQADRLREWGAAMTDMKPETQLSKEARGVLKAFAAALPQLGTGSATVEGYKADFSPETLKAAAVLTRHGLACLVESCLENTRGIHALLQRYEEEYEREVRQAGKLTFADLTLLLTRGDAPAFSQFRDTGMAADNRLALDYRLDGRHDHWALDEFQDTSRAQWRAIANLADEILQDASGARSFFMVGDVKQAIYGWRGGDSRLMTELIERYDLETEPMDASFRSCPPVLDLVNAVCGRFAGAAGIPDEAQQRWTGLWRPHRSRREKLAGCAVVLEAETSRRELGRQAAEDGDDGPQDPLADAIIHELLRLRPWERGLSAAVLTRGNEAGEDLTARLHAAGIPAVWEGEKAVAEHPLAAALLAWCRWLEHPGDTLAEGHVRMSPLRILREAGAAAAVLLEGQRLLHEHGFAGALRLWLERLEAAGALTPGETDAPEIRILFNAAAAFDAAGGRGGLDFTTYVESYGVKDVAPAGRVQVMTIHHSKGLGFDVVLLPLSESAGAVDESARGGVRSAAVDADGALAVNWRLENPGFLADADPVLAAARAQGAADAAFESLCVLYVALTRAKRELFVVLDKAPKTGATVRQSTLVRDGAGSAGAAAEFPAPTGFIQVFASGDAGWHLPAESAKTPEKRAESAAAKAVAETAKPAAPAPRHPRRLPSGQELREIAAGSLFATAAAGAGTGGRQFGTAMHRLFEELEWTESGPEEAVLARWRAALPDLPADMAAAVEAQFRDNLADPAVRAALARPAAAPGAVLWRERAFDLILDGEWITGVFDRVAIATDAAGRPAAAWLLDFKTDRVPDAAALDAAVAVYAPQLRLYRRVLARLLALPEAAIRTALLFTSARTLRLLPDGDAA